MLAYIAALAIQSTGPSDVMEIWGDISEEDRPAAIRALWGFRRTGTDG
ncbi:hypothetical protein [Brevundimonas sp. Root1279]|nr:hypothetical protein [Brevundimonas sp. Root1279]